MSKNNPCYKCEDRYVGCKSACPEWAEYEAAQKREYARRRRINEDTTAFFEVGYKPKRKSMKKERTYR